ncbi:MAG: heavy-metal-associated domain-containing protein [Sulfuricurvum sp.]|nr:heavy-metal-associated domain-containing protein [Sulfuricurvum sp.]MDP3021827.1 heavy-metal-associated domain-containing protein [Sulfuricurvum sp.]MDP3120203.1 heavy-metal-associated domain-containing protein [Sulfuricurvum sp.]
MIQTLEVRDLSCGGCAVTIRTALDIAGFTSVKVNILGSPHTVAAEIEDDNHLELMKSVLREHGYPLLEDEVPELPDYVEYDFS